MRARHQLLVDHAINMAMSAIEIYNKPDFKGREAIFSVLMVTAWEALLKAKVVKDNNNKIQSIYVRESTGKNWKRKNNSNKDYLTIGIDQAIRACGLPRIVADNLGELIEIRDAAIHLVCASPTLPYVTFVLGSATLQNFAKLSRDWFGRSLSDYNFYILPLSFSYPFQTISTADLKKEPANIARIINAIAGIQEDLSNRSEDGFYFACEIEVAVVSAKKMSDTTDFSASISSVNNGSLVTSRTERLTDKYPYAYADVWEKIKKSIPEVKQSQLTSLIKDHQIKGCPQYSAYVFKNKKEELRGANKNTPVIYNHDFVQFAVSNLQNCAE
ncbi:MAG: DUF3644 domain-containing protein [Chthonomonadales bacterium]